MPGKEKYNSLEAEQIRRYLNGEMNAAEMYALEKQALDDPFLADAIEGMQSQSTSKLNTGIADLQNRLKERTDGKVIRVPVAVIWMRAAAAVMVLALIGVAGFYLFNNDSEQKQAIVQVKPEAEEEEKVVKDTSGLITPGEFVSVDSNTKPTARKDVPVTASSKKDEPIIVQPAPEINKIQDTLAVHNEGNTAPVAAADQIVVSTQEKEKVLIPDVKVSKALSGKISGIDVNRMHSTGGNNSVFFFNGQVKDLNNQPVSFANIAIKNSNSTTYTDANGIFRFVAADTMLNIDIKSVGYAEQSAVLNFRDPNQVLLLKPVESNKLNEVVVSKSKKAKPFVEIKSAVKDSLDDEGMPEAEPVDGWGAYHLYLLNNVRIQRDASGRKIDGMVTVSFLVSESGWLSDFRIEKSLNSVADKEAMRLIKEGPKWELYNTEKPLRALVTVIF
jgi:outer membrane biosynthesis protein TonB